jgi:hypothetical protein
MKPKKIEIKGVGEILLERSIKAKHINLSVQPYKGIRVAVPYGVSLEKAEEVAHQKAGWLKKHMAKIGVMEKEAETLRKNNRIDSKKARTQLINRLNELSEKHGFRYNKVFIRNQKTRWGSCSGKNNINLNVNLARLPEDLIDYTILHELVHTRVKDHSKRFWDELEKFVKNAKEQDRKLNRYRVLLI